MNWFSIQIGHVQACLLALLLLAGPQMFAGTPTFLEPSTPNFMAPPAWSVNPLDYEFNMNLVIRINYTGTPSNATGNLLGVFVGNELRGVASPTIIAGQATYFTTVYAHQYNGEILHFRVYYAPNDAIYPTPETVTFVHNGSVGTISAPFLVNIDPNTDFPPELTPILADTTLVSIPFEPIDLHNYTVSLDGDPVTWSAQPGPNLNASIFNGILTVTPVSGAWIGTDSVRIIVTETTPNQLKDTIFGKFTVLPDYGLPIWQTIPNQTIFPGDAFTAFDLDNYLTFNGDCHQFDFDVFPFMGTAADPAWPPVVPGAQPMMVIARPLFADVPLAGPGAKLAAFVNGMLAGWSAPTGVPPNVVYTLSLKNVGAGPITFQFYDAQHQYLYVKNTNLAFAAGGSAGTVAAPYLVQVSPLGPSLAADGTVQIAIVDPAWLGTFPMDFIVWDCHFPDLRRDTTQVLFTITTDTRPHITSPATVNFEENACYTLYDTQSSDPNDSEGAGLSYSLAGGTDASRFSINAQTGILSWATGFSPDFEIPANVDMNNQYQVKIRVTNLANLSDTLALTVTITNQTLEPFVATINGGLSAICGTGTQTLQAAGGITYLWSTGATLSSIVVTAPGTYSVTVTSSGTCTATASVIVAAPPTITAAGSNTPVCAGSSIELSSTPVGGTVPYASFAWSGPNGYTASVEDPTGFPAAPAAAGVYTVLVRDAAGCTASASKTIAVSGNAAPAITANSNSPVCAGTNITLTSLPSGGSGTFTTFKWSGPNNYLAISQNPGGFPASLAAAGAYTVTVTDNAGCTATGSTAVQVNPKPTITAGSNTPVCLGNTLVLNSSPTGGSGTYSSFQWAGPNNFTATVEDPAGFPAIPAATGNYLVTVTDNVGCSATATTAVVVSGAPTIAATLLSPVCTGGQVALGCTPMGGSGTYPSFQWAGPNGFTANVQNPPAFPATPVVAGTYFVTVTDESGCSASGSVLVVMHTLPAILASNSGPVCQGASLTLNSTPSDGSTPYNAFAWTGPDNYVASSQNPAPFSTTLASAGIYQVKVTDSHGCTATATTIVVINPKTNLTASSNAPLCTGSSLVLQSNPVGGSGTYSSYQWTGPASFTATTQNPAPFTVTIANAGIYAVTVTDNAGCSATATTSVSVSSLSAPAITATSNSPICGGQNLILTSTPSGGSGVYASFAWSGPNSYTAGGQNPTPVIVYPNGSGLYTVTVTDSKSCKASTSINVVVNGANSAPTSNSPVCPNGTIQLNGGPVLGAGTTYAWTGPNNYTSDQRIPTGFPAIPAAAGVYTLTITQNGCSGQGTTTVTIGDVTPPVIVCPAAQTVNANGSCSGVIGSYSAASVSDNCAANPTVTQSPAASTVLNGHNSAQTVTLTANDGNGNTASCSFSVTLKDVTPPTVVCPANTTVAASETCTGLLGAYSAVSVSDNCGTNPTVTQSPVASTVLTGHNSAQTVTLTANDSNGNTGTCTFTVTLKDVTPPSVTCPANTTIAANASCSGLVGSYSAITVSDNCAANPVVTQSPAASTVLTGHNTAQTVTLTANDGNGNTGTCTFSVTLKDVTPPLITCPANTTIAANASCSGVVGTYAAATVSDNCVASPTVTQSPAASTVLTGHNDAKTVALTADDGNGNTTSCNFIVMLKDVTPPSITCPANATVAANASCGGVVGAYSAAAVSDNCAANPTVTQSPVSSTTLSGHNDAKTVTLTANDGNGNTASCTFTVTLKDVTPPVVTCPANTTVAANASCSGVVGAYSAVSVSDNCNPGPSVIQSPAASTVLTGHNSAQTVTLTANDGNGNTATCTFTVTLKDITPPTITCPANTTVAANATCGGVVGAYSAVAVGDNCSASPAVTQSPAASTTLSGHNDVKTVMLTANDGNGNTANCTFTVTLKDVTPPTVVCKTFSAPLNAAGTTSITTANVFQSGADNCGTVNQVSVLPNSFTCSNLGNNTVVLTVNDGNGNTATCNAVVTVVDLIPPTMLCKNATIALNASGQATLTTAQINNGSSDNCTLVTLTLSVTTFSCAQLGNNTVTLTGFDQSNNAANCTATVTVVDQIPPTMLCKNATLNLNINGQATLTAAAINNGSFDNCTIVTFNLSQTAFTCANLGTNSVKLTGIDQSGNTGECTATVTVVDAIAPTAKCKNFTANLGTNGTVTVPASSVNNGSTDNCSFTMTLTPGSFTCANIGNNTVTLKATDGSGNTNTCTAVVTIKDVTPPTALCKNATIFLDNDGKVTLLPAQVDNGSFDNCGIVSRSVNLTQFNCSDINSTKNVSFTATDGSGNSANCLAQVMVKDAIAPIAICRDTLVHLGPNGQVTIPCPVLANGSYDNCSVWSFSPVVKIYTAANIGNNNLVITVKDFSNNAATCTSVVKVLSNFNNVFGNNTATSLTVSESTGGPAQTLPQPRADVDPPVLHLVIYPNPTVGNATLAFELPEEQDFHLVVLDLMGRVVLRRTGVGLRGLNHYPLTLGELAAGLYLLELQAGNRKEWGSVLIEK